MTILLLPFLSTPTLNRDQERRCEEYRRIGTRDNTDEERQGKMSRGFGTKKVQGKKCESGRQRSGYRAHESLSERAACGLRKIFPTVLFLIDTQVLSGTVE